MQKIINFWTQHATKELVAQISQMSSAELAAAFDGEISFGTAGIRGLMGPGTKQMNIYTVMKLAYGFGKYLLAKYQSPSKVAVIIGTDNRYLKEDFSRVATGILMQMGIKVMKSLVVPTPLVAFAIKEVKAQGGIMITASHNPPNYNGLKFYDQDGGQILSEAEKQIFALANTRKEFLTFPYRENRMAIMPIVPPIIAKYFAALKKLTYVKPENNDLKIVFSPQHGTSYQLMPQLLKELGYQVIPVTEQMNPDPAFTNSPVPNPENAKAYQLGIKYLNQEQGDIMLTTDPDADRIGVMAKQGQTWKKLSGNQIGILLFDYLIKHKTIIPDRSTLIYSYVSSPLVIKMAKMHKIKAIPIATGFKWAAAIIKKLKPEEFFFAFEESHGYLLDAKICQEKDAFQAAIILGEIAQAAKNAKQTLWDVLNQIYQKYGFNYELTTSKNITQLGGQKKVIEIMNLLRKQGASLFPKKPQVIDLQKNVHKIAPMNLINFCWSFGQIMVRPSGTEPKIKLYIHVWGENKNILAANIKNIKEFVKKLPINFQLTD